MTRNPEAELPDELNPNGIFQLTDAKLLVDIVNGRLDANRYATIELARRGLDKQGEWVGLAMASAIHEIDADKFKWE